MGTCGTKDEYPDDGQYEVDIDPEAGEGPNHYFQNGQWLGHKDGRPFKMDSEGVPIDEKDYKQWLTQVSPPSYTLPEGWKRVEGEGYIVLWYKSGMQEGHRMPPKMIPPQPLSKKTEGGDKELFTGLRSRAAANART
jgi:hypothetical protein